MKVIIKRTLEETLRIPAVILVILAGLAGGYVAGRAGNVTSVPAYVNYLNERLIVQHLGVFFLINGVILMSLVSSVGSGLIAGEVHEGTIRLLVSKPNSRRTILLGKVLGMLGGSIILMILGLSTFYLAETLKGQFDGNIMMDLLVYFPAYIMYGLIVTFFFSSLAVLLSCLAKKRIIALLPMMFLIIAITAIPVIVRVVLMIANKTYPSDLLYLVDVNYHFGSLFQWCCDFYGGIKGTTSQLQMPTILMGIFQQVVLDRDVTHVSSSAMMLANNVIPKLAIVIAYAALTVVNYIASFTIISRKDV